MKASSFSNSASHSARFAHDGFARRAAGRHGVLLLVMLIMLIMFALISIMFVVTATRARLTAKTHARIDAELDPYPHLLDGAFLQLVRGSTNKYSALQYHSLLHNMYGGTPLKGATTLPKDESSVFLKGKLTVAASY